MRLRQFFLPFLIGMIGHCVETPLQAKDIFPGLQPVNVQMHIHGHSNHNASHKPGSMQWHSAEAARTGTNVIWWSDHAESHTLSPTQPTLLSAGRLNPNTLTVTNLGTKRNECTTLRATVTAGTPTGRLDANGLHVRMRADTAANRMQWLHYEAESLKGLIKSTQWARPINSGAQLKVELDVSPLNADTSFEIHVALAWHKYEREIQQQMIFQFVTGAPDVDATLVNPDTVLITVPTQPGMTLYTLNLLPAARLMRDGIDNTIHRISFHLGAKRGATAAVVLKSFHQDSTFPDATHQLATITTLAQAYTTEYGVTGHIGVELGRNRPFLLHTNAFLPRPLNDPQLLKRYHTDNQVKAWVDQVHALGGLASINHPYGVGAGGFNGLLPPAERQAATRRLFQMISDVQGYGADLMEVGYIARGGADLLDHLQLWDMLTANQLFLGGTGVTDSHGGRWQSCPRGHRLNNCFTTWIWSSSTAEKDLLHGLRQGRMYFGNHFMWQGTFAFRVGRAAMGERLSIQRDTAQLLVQFRPWPADTKVYLVQGVLQPGTTVQYLHNRTLLQRGEQPVLDTTRSTFVRLEAWRTTTEPGYFPLGDPIAFTNPIVLLSN